jgi:aconitate hydratase
MKRLFTKSPQFRAPFKFNVFHRGNVKVSNFEDATIKYDLIKKNSDIAREKLGRPLTYAEKLLFGHLNNATEQEITDNTYLQLSPDRVAMQDAR